MSRAAVNFFNDATLQIHGPAFVQEHVFPGAVCYQVTAPAVAKLMSNNINILAITCV
jgi:hypothetical protein